MNFDERLDRIEARLLTIERFIKMGANQTAVPVNAPHPVNPPVQPQSQPQLALDSAFSQPIAGRVQKREQDFFPVTNILGWAGATALVMASIYLVVLAIDAGWLTPTRQVLLSMLGGVGCIGLGLFLRDKDMNYASLMPAAGIVILFLSIYGAHNYYHLLGTTFATSGIILICLMSLWLNRLFSSEIYALFAVVGSYTAPVFLGGDSYSIIDLIVYFACWSIVFSIFSLRVQSRTVYILAMYLAFVIFDFKWTHSLSDAWVEALIFQTVHFLIFVAAASIFSARISQMSKETAIAHIPALVLFYFVQYHILEKHVPGLAPWMAAGSAAFLLASYFAVHRVLGKELEGGRMLLSSYVALVLVHAGYIESVPAHWAPWAGLVVIPLVAAYAVLRGDMKAPGTPLWVAVALIFAVNYLHLFTGNALMSSFKEIPAHNALAFLYAAELYLAYYFTRENTDIEGMGMVSLYAGHIAMMAWAIQFFDSRFYVSLFWGALALGCLTLSLLKRDKILGQSSLLIFAASILKALLYDISNATPLIRIASLLVLGFSLYLGGWLYKKVSSLKVE